MLDQNSRFYFLEMNTRLQVEHPVTEMVTGLDFVREQIRIAEGQPLTLWQSDLRQTGHAIECRIYAEVPEENFRPATGVISVYRPPMGPGVRMDSGVDEGSSVGIHFDPILGKLITWARTRSDAIERMQRALGEFVLLGVRNNIEFLSRVIGSKDFSAGAIDTGFLERHPELFHASDSELPIGALVAASVAATSSPARLRADEDRTFKDAWNSGSWSNA
jgi:acetyl/propionyl-CoA carboxylase alpha subunit